jgi:uncharacterized protein (DUF1778 family)
MNTAVPARSEIGSQAHRRAVINVRIPINLRELIDRAADVLGKTRTDFILDSARTHAIDVLLDQRLFTLDADQYDSFVQALESPPPPNEKLKRLFRSKAPWEK